MSDAVNPVHYAGHAVSPIELMDAYGLADAFARGSVVKYLCRAGEKGGHEDDMKALWYALYIVGLTPDACRQITEDVAAGKYERRSE
jgi:hypothetical protein